MYQKRIHLRIHEIYTLYRFLKHRSPFLGNIKEKELIDKLRDKYEKFYIKYKNKVVPTKKIPIEFDKEELNYLIHLSSLHLQMCTHSLQPAYIDGETNCENSCSIRMNDDTKKGCPFIISRYLFDYLRNVREKNKKYDNNSQ